MQNPNKGGRCEDNKSTRNKKYETIIHSYDSLHIQFKVMSTFICIYSFMFQNSLNNIYLVCKMKLCKIALR